jgi:hypothetical protein
MFHWLRREDLLLLLDQGLCMMGNGKVIVEKDMVFKFGLMEQGTKAIGKIIKLMGKGNLFMSMEIFMKDNGKMIKQMGLVDMNILTELLMKVSGKMTIKKEKELKNG